jgi:cytoskeleton protein RodZ
MTEPASSPTPVPPRTDAAQAGALLRAARQQQGLHIAALAAAIKVTPAKLEALEAGRLESLPDATFARALAKTVCRQLKTDPAPVLALLPGAPPGSLERVDAGLNTPFRERSSRDDSAPWLPWRHPVLWIVALLLAAAAAFVLVPTQPDPLSPTLRGDAAPQPVMPPSGAGGPSADAAAAPTGEAPAAAVGTAAASAVVPVALADASAVAASAVPSAAAAAASAAVGAGVAVSTAEATLVLRAVQATWVQAVDGSGQTLMARLVPAGETVALSPVLPVRLRIGNVKGTELVFRGQPVDLGASRDNVANLTLP